MRHSVYSIFFDQAAAHEAAERYDEALSLLYQVHRWAPEDPELWLRLGVLSFLMTDRGWLARSGKAATHLADMGAVNARLYLERAAALGPTEPRLAFWQGWVAHALYQDMAAARAALGRALELDPRYPYAHAGLARVEVAEAAAGYEGRAIAHLEAATDRLPESARFQYDLGACLAGLGDGAAAHAAFERARACPALPLAADAIGRYLSSEFHADGPTVGALVDRLYPQIAAGAINS